MKAKRAISVKDILRYKPRVMEFDGRWFDSFGTPEMRGCWLIWGGSGSGKTRFALQLSKYLTQFGRVAYNSLEEGLSFSMQQAIEEIGMSEVSKRFVLLDREPITSEEFTSKRYIRGVKAFLGGLMVDDNSSRIVAEVMGLITSPAPLPSPQRGETAHAGEFAHARAKKRKEITCLIDRLERRGSPDVVVIDSIQYAELDKNTTKKLTTMFPDKLFIFVSHAEGRNPAGRTASAVRFDADLKLFVDVREIPSPVSRFKRGGCLPFVIWEDKNDKTIN